MTEACPVASANAHDKLRLKMTFLFWISQGSAGTFFSCGKQFQKNTYVKFPLSSTGPKIINIG